MKTREKVKLFFLFIFSKTFLYSLYFSFHIKKQPVSRLFFCLFTFGLIPLSRFLNSFFNTGFNFQSQFCSFHVFIFIIIHRLDEMYLYCQRCD